MKKSKFTDEQIAFALHQSEMGTSVEDVFSKIGIAQATFYAWKKKYGGMGVSELRRLAFPQISKHLICETEMEN